MPIKDLYELIRKEDVCVWIGAGFSMYAGYPSVDDVKKILYQSLPESEQQQLNINDSLRDFTSNFAILKDRTELIRILQEGFRIPVGQTYYHQLLSKIAHFKTIITTNYDNLIEDAYTKKAITIRHAQDVPLLRGDLVKIFKIHGDINQPDSIILTREDYSRFNNPTTKDIFWSAVRNEIATKHILFLGYGYEDENIWAEFDTLHQQTAPNLKKRYLVGRPMSSIKHKMLENLQIEFIQADYENFLPELVEHLKLHLPADLKSGHITSRTASNFISSFDLDFKIEDQSGDIKLLYVNKKGAVFAPKLNFNTIDKAATELVTKLLNREILNVTLDASQLGNFSLTSEGFGLMGQDDIGKLELMSLPLVETNCSLVFPGKDFEMEGGKFQLYGTHTKYTIKGELRKFKVEFSVAEQDGKNGFRFHITEPKGPSTLTDLKDIFQTLLYLAEHEPVHIHLENRKVIKQQFTYFPELQQYQMRVKVFNAMKKIERSFQVKFPKFKIHDLKNNDVDLITKLESLIDNGYYAISQKETAVLDVPIDDQLMKIMKDMPQNAEVYWQSTELFSPELLGITLNCGKQQLTMINAKFLQMDQEKRTALFSLHNDTAIYHYEKFGFKKSPSSETLWSRSDAPAFTESATKSKFNQKKNTQSKIRNNNDKVQ